MDQKKAKARFSLNFPRLSLTVAAAALCLIAPHQAAAVSPNSGANVTFTASGTFAATPVSGADTLKLAGQPFTITVVGNSSMAPSQHGRNWCLFVPLPMNGTVYSGLLGPTPIPISSSTAAIFQAVGANEDVFKAGFPIDVIGIALTARAVITMPGGTMTTPLIHPFPSVSLTPSNATISYSNTTATTVLAVETGTLVATAAATAAQAALALPSGVEQAHSFLPLWETPGDFMDLIDRSVLAPRSRDARVVLASDNRASKAIRIQFE